MEATSFTQHLAKLAAARDWRPGDHVKVTISGRTGTLVSRCKVARDGWIVKWDEPMFGVESGRVSIPNLERIVEEEAPA